MKKICKIVSVNWKLLEVDRQPLPSLCHSAVIASAQCCDSSSGG